MKTDRQRIADRVAVVAVLAATLGMSSMEGRAATTEYQYDALGRLRRVVHDNGYVTNYTLDAAGNRTQVDDAPPAPPAAPASINVPPTALGTYAVFWGASSAAALRYELFESTTAAFTAQTSVYSGAALNASLSRLDGTYYYRVRACGTSGCGAYTTGANGVVVVIPPPAPANLTSTHVANCSWRANWDAVTGATNYRVAATDGTEQIVAAPPAYVTCHINNQNANKPKWVQACSAAGVCSTRVNFP